MSEIKCFISEGGGKYFVGPKDKTIRYIGNATGQVYDSMILTESANHLLGLSAITFDELIRDCSPVQLLVLHAWRADQLEEPDDNCNQ